jgi:hypothetical protein
MFAAVAHPVGVWARPGQTATGDLRVPSRVDNPALRGVMQVRSADIKMINIMADRFRSAGNVQEQVLVLPGQLGTRPRTTRV